MQLWITNIWKYENVFLKVWDSPEQSSMSLIKDWIRLKVCVRVFQLRIVWYEQCNCTLFILQTQILIMMNYSCRYNEWVTSRGYPLTITWPHVIKLWKYTRISQNMILFRTKYPPLIKDWIRSQVSASLFQLYIVWQKPNNYWACINIL